jgi:competence protein ComEA
MLKKILAVVAMLYAAATFAAVDVNKATAAELDSVKGIGPAISGRIVDERKKGNYKDWNDFIERVKGVGEGNAAKFSADGLTVGGAAYKGAAAAAPAAKKDDKPAAVKEEKKDPKAEAKAKADDAKKAKAEEKAKVAAEKKAKAEDAKKAKEDGKKAKEAKPVAKDEKKDDKKDAKTDGAKK